MKPLSAPSPSLAAAPRWLALLLLLLATTGAVGCEPSRPLVSDSPGLASDDEATLGASAVNSAEAPPAFDATASQDELRLLVQAAEKLARLNVGFALSRRVTLAEAEAQKWGARHFRVADDAVDVHVIGTRSGMPAFAISAGLAGAQSAGVLIAAESEVLAGERGFARFVTEYEPQRDAVRWASAWLVLVEGLATEPLGHWNVPVQEAPRFLDDGALRLLFHDARSQIIEAEVVIDAQGRATTRSRKVRKRRGG